MSDVKQLIASATRPERIVEINTRGDLFVRKQELEERLQQVGQQSNNTRLGDVPAAVKIAEEIHDVEVESEQYILKLRLRAVPRRAWRQALTDHPPTDAQKEQNYIADTSAVAEAVLAESIVEPELDAEDLDGLLDGINDAQWSLLEDSIFQLNGGDNKVPFSQIGSAVRRLYGAESKSPESGESPSDDSTDGNPDSSSPSPTETKKDARLAG